MRRFLPLALTLLILAGCDKEPPSKLDNTPQGVELQKRILLFQQRYDPGQLGYLAEAHQQCNESKKQCISINAVKPDGSMQDCVTLVVPECFLEFAEVLQHTADTVSGCNDNTSTFCQSFLDALDSTLKLPASSQSTYGWTLDTPYFHGNQWDYRIEVYSWEFRVGAALLGVLLGMILLYRGLRYYDQRKLAKQQAKEAAESAAYWKAKHEQESQEQKKVLKPQKLPSRRFKTRKPYGISEDQKKRDREALKAIEEAEKQKAEQLAQEQEEQANLEAMIADFKKLL